MFIGKSAVLSNLIVLLLAVVFPGGGVAALSSPDRPTILNHDLIVELIPPSHGLVAKDQVELEIPPRTTSVAFTLAPTLQVDSIVLRALSIQGQQVRPDKVLSFTREQSPHLSAQHIVITLPAEHDARPTLVWSYRGVINDPPKEPRHLRFVTPSETAGHIGPEGVYLSSESQWYPDIEGSLGAYRVTAQVPQDWTVVTQGRKIQEATAGGGATSTWVVQDRSEALTLVANKFVTKSREWKGQNGQLVELATYFFPDNADLADEYLDATSKYLDRYVPMLGDYPFEKFAVVENFFASGLGMPSFTLLGSGSIKRHYVQPYALGHEIVHSWIGNSVFNRAGHGNWVEGLTTYLTNYYWHELSQDARQALEQRRLMMQGYSVYVTPEQDYPVAQFLRKNDERDNAIGYQKAALVFHLLRREIGDDSFWRGLKTFVSQFRNRTADWGSLEAVFSQESHQDLRWFFVQWVEQSGAPALSLGEISAHRVKKDDGREAWQLTVQLQQTGKPFRIAIPLVIIMKETMQTRWMAISHSENTAEFLLPHQPLWVKLDPDLMAFRRFARDQLPPMLNGYVTDPHKTVVRAFRDSASPLQQVVARIVHQEAQLPETQKTRVLPVEGATLPPSGSVLMLAEADQRRAVQSIVKESCGDLVTLGSAGFQIDGQTYEGPLMAVLFSCHRANVPGSVITVLYGVTPQAVAKISRLLFYYGWQSYVIFDEGAVVKRELWQSSQDMKEVRIDGNR
ncbi:MAG: M1 family metallopeptidase [Nitrospiraceae bacterium]